MNVPFFYFYLKCSFNNTSIAAAIAILIFEIDSGPKNAPNNGRDFFTQFISANLGSLVSQGLLNGDQKIRLLSNLKLFLVAARNVINLEAN